MPTILNHLKNRDSQNKPIAMASGMHVVSGYPVWSYSEGVAPNRQSVVRQVLGEGVWDSILGAWYRGKPIATTDYRFMPGERAAPPDYRSFTVNTAGDTLSFAGLTYENGMEIVFFGANLPAPLEPDTSYYVANSSGNTFQLETSPGAGVIDLTSGNGNVISGIAKTRLPGYSPFFPTDIPHSETAILDYKTPPELDFKSSEKDIPSDFTCIAKCEKFYDYDLNGDPIPNSLSYTTNGARIFAGWYLEKGGSKDRINWPNWQAFRDYIGANEMQDHSSVPNAVGFGITTSFFNNTAFGEFVSKRVEPFIDFQVGLGAPALGMDPNDFSVRIEGKFKAKTTETYTFRAEFSHSIKLWIDGFLHLDSAASPQTFTKSLTADQFYNFKLEWIATTGSKNLKISWSSPSQKEEVIPPENLFPLAEPRPRYESHLAFSENTDLDEMIKQICIVNNALMQDIDGKINFYCYEQLASSFDVIEDMIIEDIRMPQRALKQSDIKLRWEADFRDIDSQYLEKADAINPLFIELPNSDDINANAQIETVSLPNMSRWQARKILNHLIKKRITHNIYYEMDCDARCYPIIAGDLIRISYAPFEWVNKLFLVAESRDKSPESTADDRSFIIQEWSLS